MQILFVCYRDRVVNFPLAPMQVPAFNICSADYISNWLKWSIYSSLPILRYFISKNTNWIFISILKEIVGDDCQIFTSKKEYNQSFKCVGVQEHCTFCFCFLFYFCHNQSDKVVGWMNQKLFSHFLVCIGSWYSV